MTDVMEKPRTVTRRFELEPRVQLLPAFVAQRAKIRSAISLGVLLVVLGIVLAGGLFAFGVFRVNTAQGQLSDASTTTQDLLLQQAEFRIATDTAAMVAQTSETQLVATSYEISWGRLLNKIRAAIPEGGELASITATNQAPWEAPLDVEDPLRTPRIATIEMVLDTATIQDAMRVNERLADIEGYADSTVISVAVGVDGRATTTLSLTLSTDAVTGRFLETEEETGDGSADSAVSKSFGVTEQPAADATDVPVTDGGEG